MDFKGSLVARYHSFVQQHYSMFKDGRKLSSLKNIHAGRRCFIIGNGPSLTADDLTTLFRFGEITFAFNRIFYIFSKTPWRPTYYVSQDEKMLSSCIKEVEQMSAKYKFIPIEMVWDYGINVKDATYFHFDIKNELHPSFSEDISKSISISKTVVYTAIQIAVYMGIREIYIIGVDHHFRVSQKSNGEIIIDPNVKDYFSEEYNADKNNLWIPNTDESLWTYVAAKKHADELGVKIYNATRGGKLEVFDRVDFDTLF